MNYKVMKRPMFRMGGSTTPRENFDNGSFPTDSSGFLKSAIEKYRKQQESAKQMGSFQTLKNVARLSPFLQQDTNNPLEYLSNIVSDPTLLSEVVLPGMSEKKKIEMAMNDPKTDLAFAKAMKPSSGSFSTRMKSQAAIKGIQADINELNIQFGTATPEQKIIIRQKIKDLNEQKRAYLSGETLRMQAYDIYMNTDKGSEGVPPSEEDLKEIEDRLQGFMGGGGRVGRQLGSPMMGEQPMQQQAMISEQPMQQENQMVQQAGQQQEEEKDPYKYLRDRLPPEIPDQVVQLIAYNKEAFNDFASIEAQDDVDQFNKKYNVELVVNV